MVRTAHQRPPRATGNSEEPDDHLPKPFALEELLARVAVLCRRAYGARNDALRVGALEIDLAARRLRRQGAEVELTALDNDIVRVGRIARNLSRLELDTHRIIHGDAAHPAEWWDGKQFDRILADVPCSASGVVCRHPDIKWLRRESDLSRFGARQGEILDALWQILTRDGKLLYATCSVFAEENKLQVEKFLRHHSDASLLPLSQVNTIDGQLLPNSHHDGFFYALLHKA